MSGDFISNHSNVRLIILNAVVWFVLVSIMVCIMNLFLIIQSPQMSAIFITEQLSVFLYAFKNSEMLSDLAEFSYQLKLGTEYFLALHVQDGVMGWCNPI